MWTTKCSTGWKRGWAASKGYVLSSDGHTVRKAATASSTASATASPTAANPSATASASPLPTSGGPSLIWVFTLLAALVLVGSGVAALALLRRGFS
jgi:hypothetical protein